MKKTLSILLAAMLSAVLLLSVVACDTGDDPTPPDEGKTPGTSQNGENNNGDAPDPSGDSTPGASQNGDETTGGEDEEKKPPVFGWPTVEYASNYPEWTGSGTIVDCYLYDNNDYGGKMFDYYSIKIDQATMTEVEAYVNALKADGFTHYNMNGDDEPAFEFQYGVYNWAGKTADGHFIQIEFWETQKKGILWHEGDSFDIMSQLYISIWDAFPYI